MSKKIKKSTETTVQAPAGPPPVAEKVSVPRGPARLAYDPKAETRLPRSGSKRANVLEILSTKGATVEGIMEQIGWNRQTALDGIRLIHHACGFGLRTDENGTIRAYGPAPAAAPKKTAA